MVCFSTNRFLLCLGKSCLYPSAKIQNFIEIQSNIIELHPKSLILSSCEKGSLTFWDGQMRVFAWKVSLLIKNVVVLLYVCSLAIYYGKINVKTD